MDNFWPDEAELEVVIDDDRWAALDLPGLSQTAFSAVLSFLQLNPDDWGATIMGCDDQQIMALNGEFRSKSAPTNVLSWPSAERAAGSVGAAPDRPDPQDRHLGDIAISYDTCLREASAAGVLVDHHVTHLLVHGVLHLLGYDHIEDADADLMEKIEIQVLDNLGIADPYKTGLQ